MFSHILNFIVIYSWNVHSVTDNVCFWCIMFETILKTETHHGVGWFCPFVDEMCSFALLYISAQSLWSEMLKYLQCFLSLFCSVLPTFIQTVNSKRENNIHVCLFFSLNLSVVHSCRVDVHMYSFLLHYDCNMQTRFHFILHSIVYILKGGSHVYIFCFVVDHLGTFRCSSMS